MMEATSQEQTDYIDDTRWSEMIANLLGADTANVLSRKSTEIHLGAGAGTRLYRITGAAEIPHRRQVDWTLVVKFFSLDAADFQAISTDEQSWSYWKREWQVYRSPWEQQLAGPFVAPRLIGSGEVLDGAALAWIALEDLHADDHRPWRPARFGEVARHVGVFNAGYLESESRPAEPWLSQRWLSGWTGEAGPLIDALLTVADHPVIKQIYPREAIDNLLMLWDRRDTIYDTLDRLPQTLCHNDVFPRNLFSRRAGGRGPSVAIDWAICGPAAVGQELATLVGATQVFRESSPERWEDLEQDCLSGYTAGLRSGGSRVDDDEVVLGYLLSYLLRFGVGGLPPVLALTLTEEHRRHIEPVFGCSFGEFVANVAAQVQFLGRRMVQVSALLGL